MAGVHGLTEGEQRVYRREDSSQAEVVFTGFQLPDFGWGAERREFEPSAFDFEKDPLRMHSGPKGRSKCVTGGFARARE